jgi:hypothetical protein
VPALTVNAARAFYPAVGKIQMIKKKRLKDST